MAGSRSGVRWCATRLSVLRTAGPSWFGTEGDVAGQHRVAGFRLNGRLVDDLTIAYADVMAGGELMFELER